MRSLQHLGSGHDQSVFKNLGMFHSGKDKMENYIQSDNSSQINLESLVLHWISHSDCAVHYSIYWVSQITLISCFLAKFFSCDCCRRVDVIKILVTCCLFPRSVVFDLGVATVTGSFAVFVWVARTSDKNIHKYFCIFYFIYGNTFGSQNNRITLQKWWPPSFKIVLSAIMTITVLLR